MAIDQDWKGKGNSREINKILENAGNFI